MPLFSVAELRERASLELGPLFKSLSFQRLEESVAEFSAALSFDIFMSHSKLDADLIYGLKGRIEDMGYSVYVDWAVDRELDRSKVNRNTARSLKYRMQNCRSLFFAWSKSSGQSVWMPWELGYFDGYRGKVAIAPISEHRRHWFIGQEYLGLYPYVTTGLIQNTEKETLWITESPTKYVSFRRWLKDGKPSKH
jgi:hypothetical protein